MSKLARSRRRSWRSPLGLFPALRAIGAIGAGGVIAAFGAVGAIATAAPVAAAPLVAGALSIQGVQGGPSASGAPSAPSAPGAGGPSTAPDPSRLAGAPRGGSGDFEFLMANLLVGDGMLPEALSAFEEAEKARPDSAYIHLEHAQLLARLAQAARLPSAQTGYLRQATDEVGKARRLAPHNLDVLRGVGLVYLEMAGQDPAALHTALEALETVHQSDPQDLQTAISLGRLYLEQQQPAKAAEVFREVIHESPQQRAAYALLVEALLRDDKAREPERFLAQILDFEPAALEARLTLAELEGRRNDYAAVLATLGAAPEPGRADRRLQRQLTLAY